MKKKLDYQIKTKVSKGPLVFTLITLISSVIIITLLSIFFHNSPLGIVAIIFMSIIAIASIGVLLSILLDYAAIIDDKLIMRFIFKKNVVEIKDIKKMKNKDGVYTCYDKDNKKLGTINSMNIDADKLILILERKGKIDIE